MPDETIIATSGGTNWNWYHWFDITNGVAHETRADRWRRFDYRTSEPEPETPYTVEFLEKRNMAPSNWNEIMRQCDRAIVRDPIRVIRLRHWVDGKAIERLIVLD